MRLSSHAWLTRQAARTGAQQPEGGIATLSAGAPLSALRYALGYAKDLSRQCWRGGSRPAAAPRQPRRPAGPWLCPRGRPRHPSVRAVLACTDRFSRRPRAGRRESPPRGGRGALGPGAPRPDWRRARSGGAGAGGGAREPTRAHQRANFFVVFSFFLGAPRPRSAAACSVGVLRQPPPLGGARHVAARRRRHAARRRVGRPFGVGGGGAFLPRRGVGAWRFAGAAGVSVRAACCALPRQRRRRVRAAWRWRGGHGGERVRVVGGDVARCVRWGAPAHAHRTAPHSLPSRAATARAGGGCGVSCESSLASCHSLLASCQSLRALCLSPLASCNAQPRCGERDAEAVHCPRPPLPLPNALRPLLPPPRASRAVGG